MMHGSRFFWFLIFSGSHFFGVFGTLFFFLFFLSFLFLFIFLFLFLIFQVLESACYRIFVPDSSSNRYLGSRFFGFLNLPVLDSFVSRFSSDSPASFLDSSNSSGSGNVVQTRKNVRE